MSIVALHLGNFFLQLAHLFLGQHFLVLNGRYHDEFAGISVPVVEHGARQFGACV